MRYQDHCKLSGALLSAGSTKRNTCMCWFIGRAHLLLHICMYIHVYVYVYHPGVCCFFLWWCLSGAVHGRTQRIKQHGRPAGSLALLRPASYACSLPPSSSSFLRLPTPPSIMFLNPSCPHIPTQMSTALVARSYIFICFLSRYIHQLVGNGGCHFFDSLPYRRSGFNFMLSRSRVVRFPR